MPGVIDISALASDATTTAPSARPAIALEDVGKRYGRREVLRGLTLHVEVGECFALVGTNGAGKTTCLKGMLDFQQVDAGTIEIFGVPHTRTEARARLAFLPERFSPPYYLTGGEFLAYMSRLGSVVADGAAERDACARLDLAPEALSRPVREYSKGMAQKLGIVACLLSGRDLLVLDEPMSGLDPKARLLVKRELAELRRAGRTLFFSTHMLADVAELCDRLGVLHGGRLAFVGTPAECLERFPGESLEAAYLRCVEDDAEDR